MRKEFNYGSLREKPDPTSDNISSLSQWLEYLFPAEDICYDIPIPKDLWYQRNSEVPYHRYRPDARIENLNLIVEFDGVPHYQTVSVIHNDEVKSRLLSDLGYKVIRIPFYVQLTSSIIEHYFGIEGIKGCRFNCGFYSLTKDPKNLNPNCPANFSSLGLKRFIRELEQLPDKDVNQIYESLVYQAIYSDPSLVLPDGNQFMVFESLYRRVINESIK